MTWKRGESGNPGGRPVSTHTAELRALLRRAAPAVAVRVLKAALEDGDMAAARLILERVMPVARSAPVDVDLSGGSFRERMTAVLEGMTAQPLASPHLRESEHGRERSPSEQHFAEALHQRA